MIARAESEGRESPRLAFTRVGIEAVMALAEKLEEQTLRQALRSGSTLAIMAAAFASDQAVAVLGQPAQGEGADAVLLRMQAKAGAAKERLLHKAGGTLTSGAVAALLGISLQAVSQRRKAGKLLGVDLGHRRGYGYPRCQFTDAGELLPGLDRVLEALEGHSPWTQLAFLVNPNAWLYGDVPRERLASGRVEEVVEAARELGAQGAA